MLQPNGANTLVIAIGNSRRGDDGVAQQVLRALSARAQIHRREVAQLTPDLAAEIAVYQLVVFVDADGLALHPRIEPVNNVPAPTLTRVSTPGEIVALAQVLFEFKGRAYTCFVPARSFSPGEEFSGAAGRCAIDAARQIESLMNGNPGHIIGA
jgi:Ni,Fe-hydrogenase maturation factor